MVDLSPWTISQDALYLLANVSTTVGCLGASFCLALRQILHNPDVQAYPPEARWLRWAMFGFMIVLFFLGTRMAFATMDGQDMIPPDATPHMAIMAVALLAYKVCMLISVLQKRKQTILAVLLDAAFLPYRGTIAAERRVHRD